MMPFRPYEGRQPYIYADFSHKDNKIIFPVLKAMKQDGYRIWYSGGIRAGDNWRDETAERIHNCTVGMIFLSKSSLNSEFFYSEVNELLDCEKTTVPVYLDTEIDLTGGIGLYLRTLAFIALYEDETPVDFLRDLEKLEVFAPCRDTQKEAG